MPLQAAAPARWGRRVLWFCRRKRLGAIGALGLLIVVATAVFGPALQTYDPLASSGAAYQLKAPGAAGPHGPFLLGTDQFARDVFSRIIAGARISLEVGVISVAAGLFVGTVLGVASGYGGGAFDLIGQRIVDAALGFPPIVMAMLLVAALGSSLWTVVLAIAISFIPRFVRLARSSAITIRETDYVTAAKALGAPGGRILFMHVLPNSLTSVIALATGLLGTAIVTEASLSFLGLGVPPPQPAWGSLLNEARQAQVEVAPWMAIFPGIALSATVIGFNLFGDALRDVLDPRLRGG